MTEAVALASRRTGEGPPVLVLHGLLGQSRNWQAIAKRLGAQFELWLLDLRNHGASPWTNAMSYHDMAADLGALIERERLGPARLIGHSMGGKAAMALALTRPDLVERLCVVDVAPVPYPHQDEFERYIRGMLGVDFETHRRRAEIEEALKEVAPDPGIRAFLATNLEVRDGTPRWLPNLEVLLKALPGITGWPDELSDRHYDGPTLFLRGEHSTYVADAYEPAMRALFANLTIETVEGAGHWLHAEKPDATARILEGFLGGDARSEG